MEKKLKQISVRAITLRRPQRFSKSELNRVSVELLKSHENDLEMLKCKNCDGVWLVGRDANDRRINRYWMCPNMCNESYELNPVIKRLEANSKRFDSNNTIGFMKKYRESKVIAVKVKSVDWPHD